MPWVQAEAELRAEGAGASKPPRAKRAVTDLLSAAAAKHPIVLMIDDLQWIDEGSASLLHYVLRMLGPSSRLLFVGSARRDEIDDNPWRKRVVGAATEGGAVRRMALLPLGADEAAQFFGPEASAGDVAAALRQSGGNPLFLTELARSRRLTGARVWANYGTRRRSAVTLTMPARATRWRT
jgi:predicted ATPase